MKEKYMACKKCGKREELYYIMNPKCGWCKRADPVVDELIKDGYKVTTLDVQKAEDQKKANTIKEKCVLSSPGHTHWSSVPGVSFGGTG